jgi:hypothetical protein
MSGNSASGAPRSGLSSAPPVNRRSLLSGTAALVVASVSFTRRPTSELRTVIVDGWLLASTDVATPPGK